jgi:hypothetical protein
MDLDIHLDWPCPTPMLIGAPRPPAEGPRRAPRTFVQPGFKLVPRELGATVRPQDQFEASGISTKPAGYSDLKTATVVPTNRYTRSTSASRQNRSAAVRLAASQTSRMPVPQHATLGGAAPPLARWSAAIPRCYAPAPNPGARHGSCRDATGTARSASLRDSRAGAAVAGTQPSRPIFQVPCSSCTPARVRSASFPAQLAPPHHRGNLGWRGTPSTTGPASPCSTMLAAAPSTPLCASAVTTTRAPSARSAIGCSMSPVRCFATAPNLTPH